MTPAEDIDPIKLPRGRCVPEDAVSFKAVTASGPGGQHVNKTASRVELRVDLGALPLSERELGLVRERLASRINALDELVVSSQRHRSQLQNRRAARRRMEELLAESLVEQAPRVPTRIPRAVQRRLREAKQQRSARKQARRWRPGDGD